MLLLLVEQKNAVTDDRVRDWSQATQGAVRSGTKHRSESVVAQSPTPFAPNYKNSCLFL